MLSGVNSIVYILLIFILILEYYFTDKETMRKAIENNEFIEHTHFLGNLYGTRFDLIDAYQFVKLIF